MIDPATREALAELGAEVLRDDVDALDFLIGDLGGFLRSDQDLMRLTCVLDLDDPDNADAEAFIAEQGDRTPGRLMIVEIGGDRALVLVQDLPADARDQLLASIDTARRLAFVWHHRHQDVRWDTVDAQTSAPRIGPRVGSQSPPTSGPREPACAWLLKGSEASYAAIAEIAHRRRGVSPLIWTTAAQTRAGDLLLFYFMSPRKAVHFVARAACDSFFDRDIAVVADRPVDAAQWWTAVDTAIQVEPIPLADLRAAADGHLPLRGRSGLFLRPETIDRLPFRAKDPADQAELERIVRTPTGLAGVPHPDKVTFEVWRNLAAGVFALEDDVSRYLVEPLLRDLAADTDLTWEPQYRVGRKVADYVILDKGEPVHVIEVKKVVRRPRHTWRDSPDLAQVACYAERLGGIPATLIDSHRVYLVDGGRGRILREIERRTASRTDLQTIRRHLISGRQS